MNAAVSRPSGILPKHHAAIESGVHHSSCTWRQPLIAIHNNNHTMKNNFGHIMHLLLCKSRLWRNMIQLECKKSVLLSNIFHVLSIWRENISYRSRLARQKVMWPPTHSLSSMLISQKPGKAEKCNSCRASQRGIKFPAIFVGRKIPLYRMSIH